MWSQAAVGMLSFLADQRSFLYFLAPLSTSSAAAVHQQWHHVSAIDGSVNLTTNRVFHQHSTASPAITTLIIYMFYQLPPRSQLYFSSEAVSFLEVFRQ